MRAALVITCEHGGNAIPSRWAKLFRGKTAILRSHRGYDIGALGVAERMATDLGAPLFAATTSRLVVDLNRSVGHPTLFSEVTGELPEDEKRRILATFYEPHRARVEAAIAAKRRRGGFVFHIGVHSFTPVLNGVTRNAEIGLLYDPRHPVERSLCNAWHAALRVAAPELRVRRNYPYRGASDGFSTALRRKLPNTGFGAIEIEMNQALFEERGAARRLADLLVTSLTEAMRTTA